MKFALLGDDPAVLPLARAIAAEQRHQLTHAVHAAAILPDLLKMVPAARVVDGWESLLLDEQPDAVVISGTDAAVLEGAKQLAAAGKALMWYPASAAGTAWIYELTLIQDDNAVSLVPVLPRRLHPHVRRVRDVLERKSLGRPLLLEFEREIPTVGAEAGPPLMSPAQIDDALIDDVDTLRYLGGEYSQVTAVRSGEAQGGVSLATVTLAGNDVPQVSWSAKATRERPHWKLTLTAENGSLTLSGRDAEDEVAITGSPAIESSSAAGFDAGRASLVHVEEAITGQQASTGWSDLTRTMEIIDATHQSLKRRRTIDLHFETTSERSLFKTQMTAVGCALLSITFFAVVLLLIAGALFDPRSAAEVRAESDDFIVARDEFVAAGSELTAAGRQHVDQIAETFAASRADVIVEQSAAGDASELDAARRQTVVDLLRELGCPEAEARAVVAPVSGRWFQPAMRIARFAVFLPLFLFLALQLLVFLARPSAAHKPVSRSADPPETDAAGGD